MKLASARVVVASLTVASAGLSVALAAAPARAEDAPPVDQVQGRTGSPKAIDREWLYLDDARVAGQWNVIASVSAAYTGVGNNPDPTSAPYRAFAFNTAQPGTLLSLGGEVGLLPRLSFEALAQVDVGGMTGSASPGAVAGLRLDVGASAWRNVHLLVSGGYLRETWSAPTRGDDPGEFGPGQPNGDNGAWGQIAVSADIQRLRLGLTTHGEHVFAEGRDDLDLMIKAGASYRILDWFRAGVEWVGQDLEEQFKDAAEGGARHFVGPTASIHLLQDRFTVVAGPSIGLSTQSPKVLGRIAVAYGF